MSTQGVFEGNGFMIGRMIGGSKSGYMAKHKGNKVVFNANVITEKEGKVWHGDIDVTRDEYQLLEIAGLAGCDLYILREMDARFGTETDPIETLKRKAAYVVTSGGEIITTRN
jgi:hypothetical protein